MTSEAQGRNVGTASTAMAPGGRGSADPHGEEFLALLSHELRTPLHALLGWLHLLERDVASEVRQRAIISIERNARAMCQIIDDLADESRIRSGKLRLTLGPVDVPVLVRNVVETMRPAAEERGLSLETRVSASLPTIRADGGRLRQVLTNLVSNAVKFTPRQGRVVVEAESVENGVRIVVSDTGCGIESGVLPHLFVRFYQGRDAVARGQGLGLGLPLVKELVERHGGAVLAQSDGPGRGARFIVLLPRIAAEQPESAGEEEVS